MPGPEFRSPFDRSDVRAIASIDSDSGKLNRHDTGISTATTLSPTSTNRSGSGSTGSSTSLRYIKSERLQSVIKDGDLKTLDRLIATEGSDVSTLHDLGIFSATRLQNAE